MSATIEQIGITVNGQAQNFAAGGTVATLLAALGLDARKIAVERNREIVPRSAYDTIRLGPGDTLEIVNFVGGG